MVLVAERSKDDFYKSVLLAISLMELPEREDFMITKDDLVLAAKEVLLREINLNNGFDNSIPSQKTVEIIALFQATVVIGNIGNG